MKLWRKVTWTLAIFGLSAFAGLGAAANAKAAIHSVSGYTDANVEYAIEQALSRNPAFALVEANESSGTVVLTGTVDHYQDKVDAEAAIRDLPGTRKIQDTILVTTAPLDDLELQKQLEDRLRFARADMGITFPQVHVDVHDGSVTLSGTVKDSVEHAMALVLAGSADGVVSVRDKLNILPDSVSDDGVRTQINKAIYEARSGSGGSESALSVDAAFQDGIATLLGSVATQKDKEALISKIRGIYGVVGVEDEIVVKNQRPAADEAALTMPIMNCQLP